MKITAITFRLYAPWVHSLKEKRMIVKSLLTKLQNGFHFSAAEVDEQDTHRIIASCIRKCGLCGHSARKHAGRAVTNHVDALLSADGEYSDKLLRKIWGARSPSPRRL